MRFLANYCKILLSHLLLYKLGYPWKPKASKSIYPVKKAKKNITGKLKKALKTDKVFVQIGEAYLRASEVLGCDNPICL